MNQPISSVTFILSAVIGLASCDSKSDKEKNAAAVAEAERNASENIAEARREGRENVAQAKQTAAADAAEDARDARAAEQADERDVVHAKGDSESREETEQRFEAYNSETREAFAARGEERIKRIEGDLVALEKRKLTSEAKGDAKDVREALREARKNLAELRAGNDKLFDEGQMGIAMAINKAQRKLDNLRKHTVAVN